MADLPTPDSIGALPRSRTELVPGAQKLSVYQGATRADVANPPQTNSLAQLGEALQHIQPTLIQATGYMAERQTKQDISQAALDSHKAATDQNIKSWNDAIAKGTIQPGQSAPYNEYAAANFARLRAEQGTILKRSDYYANDQLRNDPNLDHYRAWSADWDKKYEKDTLLDENGNHNFTSLELAKSKYHDVMDNAGQSLFQEHVAHRVSENTKIGEQNATNLAMKVLDKGLMSSDGKILPPENRDYPALGRDVAAPFFGTTGAATVGMPASKARNAIVDTLAGKAIEANDPSIMLNIAKHVNGGALAGDAYFKEKFQEASLKIAGNKYTEAIHADTLGKMQVEESVAAKQGKTRMQWYADQYERTNHEAQKKYFVDAATAELLDYPDIMHMSPDQLKRQSATMDIFRKTAPEEAMKASLNLMAAKDRFQSAENAVNFPLKELELHNLIKTAPGVPATNQTIDLALRDKAITGEQWLRLRTMSDKTGQDAMAYSHILNDDSFKRLESAIGRAVNTSPGDPFGAAALHAGSAQLELRQLAVDTAKANPNMSPLMVSQAIEPQMRPIASRYNDTLKDVMDAEEALDKGRQAVIENALHESKPEVIAEKQAMVKRATEQTAAFKKFDAGQGPDPRKAAASEPIDISNFKDAKAQMKLTPQEENIYRHHLKNLNGTGKVVNADGSISTVYQMSFEHKGKTYNVPTVWDGKILSADEAYAKAESIGLDKFPSYDSEQSAESRYQKMHAFMERDTSAFLAKNKKK